jgi:hypothetical protein
MMHLLVMASMVLGSDDVVTITQQTDLELLLLQLCVHSWFLCSNIGELQSLDLQGTASTNSEISNPFSSDSSFQNFDKRLTRHKETTEKERTFPAYLNSMFSPRNEDIVNHQVANSLNG